MYANTKATSIAYTRHARERMELRAITEEMVLKAIRHPERTYIEDDGDTKFISRVDGVRLHVVCKPLPDEGKWLVKSTWVRGEDDDGNRVDRYGQRIGSRQRDAQESRLFPRWLPNAILFVIFITLMLVLLYFLSR